MAKPELRDHRKFLKLRRLLNEPTPHLIGYLECLWIRGYQTGSPIIGDELDVEGAAEYPGEVGKFAKAVVSAGFVDVDANGLHTIHDLFEHAPAYVQKRMVRKNTAPDGTTWESVTKGRKGNKDLKSSPNGLQNAKSQSERTEKPPKTQKADDKDKNQEPRTENQEPRTKNQEPKINNGISSADAVAVEKPTHPRDLLFDAIAEVTASDPVVNGKQIGGVKKVLLQANPPYSPAEVSEFGQRYSEFCPWGPKDGRLRPTLPELQKYISHVRAKPPPKPILLADNRTFRQKDSDETIDFFNELAANAVDSPQRQAAIQPKILQLTEGK